MELLFYLGIATIFIFIRSRNFCEDCNEKEVVADCLQIVLTVLLVWYFLPFKKVLLLLFSVLTLSIIKNFLLKIKEPVKLIKKKCKWCKNMWT